MHRLLYIQLVAIIAPALAANDWNRACHGNCGYESGDGVSSAWSSIILDGAPEAVSDLTTAAGWSILDCDPDSDAGQEIRIVCTNPEAGCSNLFEGGAENTIVRLPEACATAPFARVARTWTAENQDLPEDVSAELRRKNVKHEVMSLNFDFEFGSLPSERGKVTFTTVATTNPLQRTMTEMSSLKRALKRATSSARFDSELVKRDLFANFISANKIPSSEEAINRVNILAYDQNATGAEMKLFDFDKDWSKTFDLVDVNQSFNVIDASIDCPAAGDIPGFKAGLKIDADVDAKVTVSIGFIVSGTIIPPAIDKAAFTAAVEGGATAVFDINANAQGSLSTGVIPLFEYGLPGMNIPGIINIGPKFTIGAKAVATLGTVADATITAAWNFQKLELVYPESEGASTAEAEQTSPTSPLTLTIGGSAQLSGTVEAHIIPRVEISVDLLFGVAKAAVYLQIDGHGILDMSLTPVEMATTTLQIASAPTAGLTEEGEHDLERRDNDPFGGCIDLDLGVNIAAGAEGKLLSVWKDKAEFSLYSHKWDLFDRCFGSGATSRPHAQRANLQVRQLEGLICPTGGDSLIPTTTVI